MTRFERSFGLSTKLNKGFTLIELLVVIAIIAILAAMAIPRIQEYRKAAAIGRLTNDARICLSYYAQSDALSAISGVDTVITMGVPSHCSGNATSCECSDAGLGVTVTCIADTSGTVSCTAS